MSNFPILGDVIDKSTQHTGMLLWYGNSWCGKKYGKKLKYNEMLNVSLLNLCLYKIDI